MASAKETPRQRMVGMMYLVLTALLALQVSSALIYKFQALNESLEKSSKETTAWNSRKLESIEREIRNRGSKAEEVQLLNNAKIITQKTQEVKNYIEGIKKELIKESGGYDEEGNLKGAKEETKVEVVMLGANKNGKGYELRKKLDAYIKFINENSNTKFTPLALDGREDPLFKNNPDQRNKDFAELNFGQTPLVASLAILSEYQSRVSTMEATTLTALADKVGRLDIPIDNVRPMVSPASRVVAAGTKYEAQLFMAATSSNVKPKMEFGSNPIQVDENGVGKISFTASGGPYNEQGFSRKVWTGKVTMRMPGGKDSTFTVSEEYLVAKPEIEIQSGTVPALYRNCGNKLNVAVPALGNTYDPTFSAEGARLIQGTQRGIVTVIPASASVKLKVNNGGNYVGEKIFGVRLIPAPTIEFKVNNTVVDPITSIEAIKVRNVSVKANPDKEFKKLLPEDSDYKIVEWNLTIARGRTGFKKVSNTTEYVNLGPIASELKPGDKLIYEVTKVKRKNFKGEWEEVSMPKNLCVYVVVVN